MSQAGCGHKDKTDDFLLVQSASDMLFVNAVCLDPQHTPPVILWLLLTACVEIDHRVDTVTIDIV